MSYKNFKPNDCHLFAVTALYTGYTKTTEKTPIKQPVKLVNSPAEISDCTSRDESPGKAYVEVGLINPSAAFVTVLKRILFK